MLKPTADNAGDWRYQPNSQPQSGETQLGKGQAHLSYLLRISIRLPAFNKNSVSRMPNYGPPGSERQDDRSLAERFGFGVLKDTPIAKTFAEFGNFPVNI
jgi:hypothetical protein